MLHQPKGVYPLFFLLAAGQVVASNIKMMLRMQNGTVSEDFIDNLFPGNLLLMVAGGLLTDKGLGTRKAMLAGSALIAIGLGVFFKSTAGIWFIMVGQGLLLPAVWTEIAGHYPYPDNRKDLGFTIPLCINGLFVGIITTINSALFSMNSLAAAIGLCLVTLLVFTLNYAIASRKSAAPAPVAPASAPSPRLVVLLMGCMFFVTLAGSYAGWLIPSFLWLHELWPTSGVAFENGLYGIMSVGGALVIIYFLFRARPVSQQISKIYYALWTLVILFTFLSLEHYGLLPQDKNFNALLWGQYLFIVPVLHILISPAMFSLITAFAPRQHASLLAGIYLGISPLTQWIFSTSEGMGSQAYAATIASVLLGLLAVAALALHRYKGVIEERLFAERVPETAEIMEK